MIMNKIEEKTGLTKSEIVDALREGIPHYSFSKIEKYNVCSLQWFYRYILNFVEQTNAPALVGHVLHETLKEYFEYLRNTGVIIDEERFLIIFRTVFNKVNNENLKILEGYNYSDAMKLTKKIAFDIKFVRDIVVNPDYDVKFEEEKIIYIQGRKFKLIIDLVAEPLVEGLPLIIVDYKSSYHKENKYVLQLMTYFLAYKKNFDSCKGILVYPRHDKSKEGEIWGVEQFSDKYEFNRAHIKKSENYILSKIENIECDIKFFNIAPSPNKNCIYCSFSDICTYDCEFDKKTKILGLSDQEIGEQILYLKSYLAELQKIMKQTCDRKGEVRIAVNGSNPDNDVIFYKDETPSPYVEVEKFQNFCKNYGLNHMDYMTIDKKKLKLLLSNKKYSEINDVVSFKYSSRLNSKEIKAIF